MKIAITHSTTACVLLEIGSIRILTDPVFDPGVKKYSLGPFAEATRYIGPAIDPDAIFPLDAILLSHAHHLDNLDETGARMLDRASSVITGTRDSDRAGPAATRLAVWQSTTISGADGFSIRVTATPACHGPVWLPSSYHVVGFLLEWQGQDHGGLYISGDTVYFHGLRQISKRFQISAALLHLGGVNFWPPWPPFLRFTMTARQAARCLQVLRARVAMPIHYEKSVWSHFKHSKSDYENAFAEAGVLGRIRWLRPAERTVINV